MNNNYFSSRMDQIKFDPKVHVAAFDPMPGDPLGKMIDIPIFKEDKFGNILIHYFDLNQNIISIEKDTQSKHHHKIRPFSAIRFKNPKGDKYCYNKSGFEPLPYLGLNVCKAFQKKSKVKKLVITEGQFKVFYANHFDIFIVGIPGITVWKSKRSKKIFHSIEQIIKVCKVEEIIYLTDADTLSVNWEENKDLAKRPFQFYNSIKFFKNLCEDFKCKLYFSHIKTESKHKGLDDLLMANEGKEKQILSEIKGNKAINKYIEKFDLSTFDLPALRKYFKITDAQTFYDEYEETIGNRSFIFYKAVWQYDEDLKQIVCLRSEEAAQYMYIGNHIYKKGSYPGDFGIQESTIIRVSDGRLKADLNMEVQKHKKVMREMAKYDGMVNIPGHSEHYQRFISTEDTEGNVMKWYNKYQPITHNPKEGSFELTDKFIKHIFGDDLIVHQGHEIRSYELGYDYLQLLWTNPKHILPILCLVSRERGTGKTKFCEWLRLIFQQNAVQVTNDQLASKFTSYHAHKLIAYVDETFIEKKAIYEKIKNLSTSSKIASEGKGQDAVEIECFLKWILCSNNVTDFIRVDEEEIRFWVREIPSIPNEEKNYNIIEDLLEEVPHFLEFLNNREMVTKKQSRAWFHTNLLETNALRRLKRHSKNGLIQTFEQFIVEKFTAVQKPILNYSPKLLIEQMGIKNTKPSYLKSQIIKEYGIPFHQASKWFSVYEVELEGFNDMQVVKEQKVKKSYFEFTADRFLSFAELLSNFTPDDLIELEALLKKRKMESFWNPDLEEIKTSMETRQLRSFSTVVYELYNSEAADTKTIHEALNLAIKKESFKEFYNDVQTLYKTYLPKLNIA